MRAADFLPLLAGLLFPFFPSPLNAQVRCAVPRAAGESSLDQMGSSVSRAGDVDGDGVEDAILGAPFADPGGRDDAGSAFVISGATGQVLLRLDGQALFDNLGSSVAGAGDVDGDGFADLIAGAPFADPNGGGIAGSAFLFSGATGALLRRFDAPAAGDFFGWSVAGAGDLDGDGIGELLIGSLLADSGGALNAGAVFVFSGATGAQLMRLDGTAPFEQLGQSVAPAGDLDGDGVCDLIAGAAEASPGGLLSAGSVLVFSGANGSLLFRFDGPSEQARLGFSVAGAGDVDGDGVPDLIAGARFAAPGGVFQAGSAFVFSGSTGSLLHRLDGQGSGFVLGSSVDGGEDLDGDGLADLLAGAPGANVPGLPRAGRVVVFSGATGNPVFHVNGLQAGARLGTSAGFAGDVDGDGIADLVAGAPFATIHGQVSAGAVRLVRSNPILSATNDFLGFGPGGSIGLHIQFPPADAGAAYRILVSASGTGPVPLHGLLVPLTPDKLFQASRRGMLPGFFSGFQGNLDAQGRASATVFLPPPTLPLKLRGRDVPLFLVAVNNNFDQASGVCTLAFTP